MSILCRPESAVLLVIASLAPIAACTEPRDVERPKVAPPPALEARLELSDSTARAGTQIRVIVRLRGAASTGVASITARLAYDSSAFRFVAEDSLSDGVLRVLNPESGMIRLAAVAPNGFPDGKVYGLRFAVRRPASIGSLSLTVDELHTAGGAAAAASVAPARP